MCPLGTKCKMHFLRSKSMFLMGSSSSCYHLLAQTAIHMNQLGKYDKQTAQFRCQNIQQDTENTQNRCFQRKKKASMTSTKKIHPN